MGGSRAGACAASCRLERKSLGIARLRKLRKVWVRERLLTATVSGQQAPAPTTAMPAVQRIAEVIDQSPKSLKDIIVN